VANNIESEVAWLGSEVDQIGTEGNGYSSGFNQYRQKKTTKRP